MSLELEREQAVQALCAHYAQDHLSTGELEARFDRIYKSTSPAQLATVLEGLPSLARGSIAPAPMYHIARGAGALPSNEKRYLAVFSEVKKEGVWTPTPIITARAVFGSILLDLRDADLPAEGLMIDIDVIFGDATVLLPPGLGADVDCSAVLGAVEDKAQRGLPGAPLIRVRGGTIFGQITVKTKLPKKARLESWREQLRGFLGTDASGKGQ